MNIYETARNMEQEGRDFYKHLAAKAPTREITAIFSLLAQEEQWHYDFFDSMSRDSVADVAASTIAVDVKRIFSSLASHFEEDTTFSDQEAAYSKALELEQKSVAFYSDMAAKSTDKKVKSALNLVIAQELLHERLIEGLKDFIHRPKEWVEDAEFNHFDEY